MVIAWVVVAALLLLFELHHLAFYALFGSVGSLAGAAVALVAPSAIGAQGAVAVGVAAVGVAGVRPFVSRRFANRREGHVALGVHGGLIGQEAIALDEVGDANLVGHVRLAGERWLAVSGGQSTIASGKKVLVMAVQGTTLVVWPVDEIEPPHKEAPDGADGSTPWA